MKTELLSHHEFERCVLYYVAITARIGNSIVKNPQKSPRSIFNEYLEPRYFEFLKNIGVIKLSPFGSKTEYQIKRKLKKREISTYLLARTSEFLKETEKKVSFYEMKNGISIEEESSLDELSTIFEIIPTSSEKPVNNLHKNHINPVVREYSLSFQEYSKMIQCVKLIYESGSYNNFTLFITSRKFYNHFKSLLQKNKDLNEFFLEESYEEFYRNIFGQYPSHF